MTRARDIADLAKNANDRLDTVATSDGALSNRNLIINGAMQLSQRSASESVSTSDGYKTLDRFQYNEMGSYTGVHTMSQDTTGPSGFTNSLKFLTTTADSSLSGTDGFSLRYRVEAQDLQRLGYGTSDAKSCTLSFYVKSNVTGTYTINIQQSDATKMLGVSYTVDAANTWERKTLTFIGNTSDVISNDNGIGMQIQWGLATGPDWTSGTLRSTWTANLNADYHAGQTANVGSAVNNYWQITGVQLEVGDTATPFEHRSYGDELARCQRYFESIENSYKNSSSGYFTNHGNGEWVGPQFNFKVTKRATPSIISDLGTFSWRRAGFRNASATTIGTGASSTQGITTDSFVVSIAESGISNGTTALLFSNAGYFYTADAEL